MELPVNRKRKFDIEEDKLADLKRTVDDVLDKKCDSDEQSHRENAKLCKTLQSDTSIDNKLSWNEIRGQNLNCDYCILFTRQEADELLQECENTLTYNTGMLAKVKVFGKWHDIPRQQVAHGDHGLTYTFSNNTVPARPWMPFLERIRDKITQATGFTFNFVLINRYKNGSDHIGEHRDDEKDLVQGHPIASLSLGQPRDFLLKHMDARGKNAKSKIEPITVELHHGSLLIMKHPTNTYWYHSVPIRKRLSNVRINMTFRKMVK